MFPKKAPHLNCEKKDKKTFTNFASNTIKPQKQEIIFPVNVNCQKQFNEESLSPMNIKTNKNMFDFNFTYTPRMFHTERSQRKMEEVCFKHPILICKKQHQVRNNNFEEKNKRTKTQRKVIYSQNNKLKVEPFQPIQIPKKQIRKLPELDTQYYKTSTTKREIQIHLEKSQSQRILDSIQISNTKQELQLKDKQCLKKLFKKLHKLTDDYVVCQQEKQKILFDLDTLKNVHQKCIGNQTLIKDLQNENNKLKTQIQILQKERQFLKQQIYKQNKIRQRLIVNQRQQDRNRQESIRERIKQVIVEKPIQVIKYIPGPQRIIYVQVPNTSNSIQKKVNKGQQQFETKIQHRIVEIQKPVFIEKPVYIDKPTHIYIDKPVYVDKPIFIEKQVPIDKGQEQKNKKNNQQIKSKLISQIKYQMTKSPYLKELQEIKIKQNNSITIPYPIEVPIYIEKPLENQQIFQKIEHLEKVISEQIMKNSELINENNLLKHQISKLNISIEILKRHNEQKNREVEELVRSYNKEEIGFQL